MKKLYLLLKEGHLNCTFDLQFRKTSFTIQCQKIFLRYLMAFSDLMFDEWFFFDLCEVILHIPYSARTLCRRLYVPWHLWQNLRTGYEKLANLVSVLGRSFWKCNRGTYIQFIMELEYWNLYAWLMIYMYCQVVEFNWWEIC